MYQLNPSRRCRRKSRPTEAACGPAKVDALQEQPQPHAAAGQSARTFRQSSAMQASASALLFALAILTGCAPLTFPSARKLDLMSPSSSLLFPGQKQADPEYRMVDGREPTLADDGSMTMEAYQKIREAKTNHSVVLQVAGDEEAVRVLPLPPGNQSVFVSELLTQTGLLKRFGAVDVLLYRPSAESISGIRMQVRFNDEGMVDPATDYGLRPGDRLQVTQKDSGAWQALVNMALRR